MKNLSLSVCAAALIVSGCSTWKKLDNTEQGTVAGTAIGAGLGGIVGSQVGAGGAGVALGAAAGALTGNLLGREQDSLGARKAQQDEQLRRQRAQLDAQQQMLNDMKVTRRE